MQPQKRKSEERPDPRRFTRRFLLFSLAFLLGSFLFLFLDSAGILSRLLFCPFHALGFYCPGCGGTRAVWRLLSLDFSGAFLANPAVFPLAFCAVYYFCFAVAAVLFREPRLFRRAGLIPLYILLGTAVLWFFVRNILLFSGIDTLGDFIRA